MQWCGIFFLPLFCGLAGTDGDVPHIFYPYGLEEGDTELDYPAWNTVDTYRGPITIKVPFPFYNKTYLELFVNSVGGISFETQVTNYQPQPFPYKGSYVFLAAFWADIDASRNDGQIFYREIRESLLLHQLTSDVLKLFGSRGLYFFKATWAYIVTWINVTDYTGSQTSPVNTFQMAILTDGVYSFSVYNYGNISWTINSWMPSHAQAGFNTGDGENFFLIPGSRTPDVTDIEETSNVGIPGRWVFRTDQAKIDAGGCQSEGKCPPHEVETESGECEEIAPPLSDCPKLEGPTVQNRSFIYFYCEIPYNNTDVDQVSFQVIFLFDGEQRSNVPPFTVDGTMKRVPLHEKYLHGNLGTWLSCSVRSYYARTPSNMSQPYLSEGYFIGIEPSSYSVNVYEGDDMPEMVYLKSTLPITCRIVSPSGIVSGCQQKFNIDSSDDLIVYQPGRPGEDSFTCQYRLDESEWIEEEARAYDLDYQLEVITTRSPVVQPPKVDHISFEAVPYFNKIDEDGNSYTHFWNGYSPPTITVYRYDPPKQGGASCVASGDPRMTTFDKLYYNEYATGQFVMVKSSSVRGFEVHIRNKPCSRGSIVACVCAIAVKEGNDTLIMDMCETSPVKKLHRTASSDGKLAKGAKITSSGGNAYTISTPAGAYANVYVYSWGMNVILRVLGQDLGKTEGLCGTYDNINANDLKIQNSDIVASVYDAAALDQFIQSWRIPTHQSLFERDPDPLLPDVPTISLFCYCSLLALEEQIPCGTVTDNTIYNILTNAQFPITTHLVLIVAGSLGRKRRSTAIAEEINNIDYEYNPGKFDYNTNSTNEISVSWPTASGITENQAWTYCNTSLTGAVAGCSNYTTQVDAVITKCVEDIQVSDDMNWALDKIEEIKEDCIQNILTSNVSDSENSTASDEINDLVISAVETATADICPSQCSGQGDCINSICHCSEGFEGVDCSVNASSLPTVISVANSGVCNTQVQSCSSILLGVENIPATGNLSCRIQVENTTESFLTNGTFQGQNEISCLLPTETYNSTNLLMFYISVSKNGQDFGRGGKMTVFNGDCLLCSSSQECEILDSTCSIDGVCYDPDDLKAGTDCFLCDPLTNKDTWSISPDNHPPAHNFSDVYKKLREEDVIIQVEEFIFDPEGRAVNISLQNDSDSSYVEFQGNSTLFWKAGYAQNLSIPIILIDDCSQTTTVILNLTIIECPCPGNALCISLLSDGSGTYQCRCPEGFTDDLCLTNIDDCIGVDCNNGTCVDGITNYTCNCSDGFTGHHCEVDVDECGSSPCLYGGCEDMVAAYQCQCYFGYTGNHCEQELDECLSEPCVHGTCVDAVGGFNCSCHAGYNGTLCEVDINECQSSPCMHGVCIDETNFFSCQCEEGYTGNHCEVELDECLSEPCVHGTCEDTVGGFYCSCHAGYNSTLCEVDINECQSSPCLHGVCKDLINRFSCQCEEGYTGNQCSSEIIECNSNPCIFGNCVDEVGAYRCDCLPGYTGTHCEVNIQECISDPCVHGECVDGVNSYSCSCVAGFTGTNCEININECESSPCIHGNCIDGINAYNCECNSGFEGITCNADINECSSDPCQNGVCKDDTDRYLCNCTSGYTGVNCETNIDECDSSPCVHGACVDEIDHYSCDCFHGFTGINCETMIDNCLSSPCLHGTCEAVVAGYECHCETYYSGEHCDSDIRTGVWGQWSEYTTCSKSCDYGLQNRERMCLLEDTCRGEDTEVTICNSNACQEISEEAGKGAVLLVKGPTMIEFLSQEERLLELVSDGVNNYCTDHNMKCCQLLSVSQSYSHLSVVFNIFGTHNVYFASGYPKQTEENDVQVQIIGHVLRRDLESACNERSKREIAKIYITSEIMAEAIKKQKDTLEEVLGFEVTVVTDDSEDTPLTTSKKIYIATGVSTAVIIIIIFAVVAYLCIIKKKKHNNPVKRPFEADYNDSIASYDNMGFSSASQVTQSTNHLSRNSTLDRHSGKRQSGRGESLYSHKSSTHTGRVNGHSAQHAKRRNRSFRILYDSRFHSKASPGLGRSPGRAYSEVTSGQQSVTDSNLSLGLKRDMSRMYSHVQPLERKMNSINPY